LVFSVLVVSVIVVSAKLNATAQSWVYSPSFKAKKKARNAGFFGIDLI